MVLYCCHFLPVSLAELPIAASTVASPPGRSGAPGEREGLEERGGAWKGGMFLALSPSASERWPTRLKEEAESEKHFETFERSLHV